MGRDTLPEVIVIVNCVLNVPLMLISIIGNTLVLAAILRTPSLRSPSITLLCSLAVSDLLVGIVVQPVYVANLRMENGSLFQVLTIMVFSVCGASLFAITAISVDRFLALHYHMRYPNLMTTHRALYASATLWFICFLLSLISIWSMSFYFIFIAVIIVICIFISTVCYVKIFRIVRLHQIQIHSQQQAVESNRDMMQSKKTAINTFIYYIVMILCYTPAFIGITISLISPNRWSSAWILAETLAFMNSSINPFLYCWRFRELRTAVVKTAKQMLCKTTEEN
ncbi:melanocortin receptor 4-like [Oculina patagonica]